MTGNKSSDAEREAPTKSSDVDQISVIKTGMQSSLRLVPMRVEKRYQVTFKIVVSNHLSAEQRQAGEVQLRVLQRMQQMLDVPSEYGCATVDGAIPLKVLSNMPSSLESSKSLMDEATPRAEGEQMCCH
ncbi:hypothetical protein VNO80_13078 [Phaseolus coccineus]|uniref:Uncharacterized protein n=1 Tax=Phaseolus coccineus TaxID=3886 RepID=A0AAN9R9N9_PHACN